ncbi:glycosyltransferase family 2 protein [Candidatus Uhrbacteria bacterium]|nr:glycosyltransferase family 2 protein [Candidatus Uhrbacteria bacterium]
MEKNVFIILPAYNEARIIASIIAEVRSLYPSFHVVVVDDCSRDTTAYEARRAGADVIRHSINLGQGAAVKTGIAYALAKGAEYIVNIDADGQHSVAEIPLLLAPLFENSADIVLGSRFLASKSNVPPIRRVVLKAGILFTWFFSGIRLSDTHNGFRAQTRNAAQKIIINENRMAHASEILHEIVRHDLRFCEVPVTVRYTSYSKQRGQRSTNALHIVRRLLWRKMFLE